MASVPRTLRSLISEARARGSWGTLRAIKMNKFGTLQFLIGEDPQGNRYFANTGDTFGRDRWVEYADVKNFDSSNVSPAWHAWLHKMTDVPGDKVADPFFAVATGKNPTGTRNAYVPRAHRNSGTGEGVRERKVEMWNPKGKEEVAGLKDVLDLK